MQTQKNADIAHGQPLHDFEQKAGWAGGLSLQLGLDPGCAHGARGVVSPAGRGDGVAHEQVDLGIHFFPESGWCKHQMRGHLTHVVEHRARVFRKVDHQPQGQRVVDRRHALGDVAKRQKGHRFVTRLDVQVFGGQAQLKDQVAVEGHGPLGCPGGARGVDQKSQVFGLGVVDRGVKKGLAGFGQSMAACQEFIKKFHIWIGKAAQAFTVHHHNALQLWALGANFQGLV